MYFVYAMIEDEWTMVYSTGRIADAIYQAKRQDGTVVKVVDGVEYTIF